MGTAFFVLGLLVSIGGACLPTDDLKRRIISASYSLVIVVFAYYIVLHQEKIDRVANIEKAASKMIKEKERKYTQLGFVHASLVFLEKNKDLYPDTYSRALKMCVQYQCDSPQGKVVEMGNLSLAMSGLLSGLAVLNDVK